MLPALRMLIGNEYDDMLLRMRLLSENLVIRARAVAESVRTRDMLIGILSERATGPLDELRLRAKVAAVLAATGEAIDYWAERGGTDDVAGLVERALGALATGFSD